MTQKKVSDTNEPTVNQTQLNQTQLEQYLNLVTPSSENLANQPQREQFTHVLIGSPKVVTSIIHHLHLIGYIEVNDWSRSIPNPNNPEQVIRILVRNMMVQ